MLLPHAGRNKPSTVAQGNASRPSAAGARIETPWVGEQGHPRADVVNSFLSSPGPPDGGVVPAEDLRMVSLKTATPSRIEPSRPSEVASQEVGRWRCDKCSQTIVRGPDSVLKSFEGSAPTWSLPLGLRRLDHTRLSLDPPRRRRGVSGPGVGSAAGLNGLTRAERLAHRRCQIVLELPWQIPQGGGRLRAS